MGLKGEDMKRYRSSTKHKLLKQDPNNKYMAMIVPYMAEDPKGDWVKWEDVKEQLLEKYLCGCSPLDDIEVGDKKQCACGFRR